MTTTTRISALKRNIMDHVAFLDGRKCCRRALRFNKRWRNQIGQKIILTRCLRTSCYVRFLRTADTAASGEEHCGEENESRHEHAFATRGRSDSPAAAASAKAEKEMTFGRTTVRPRRGNGSVTRTTSVDTVPDHGSRIDRRKL